jgi:hypothetical protein
MYAFDRAVIGTGTKDNINLRLRNISWIVRVSGMQQIYKILVGEQSLETQRHTWKENNKLFLERRMKRRIILFKETVSDGTNAIFKYLVLLNRGKYFEQLTECFLLKNCAQFR